MSQRCVVLLGMMGAGKSEVGRDLADRLGYEFLDTDKLVEKRAGKKISKIFAEEGESAFRALEHEVIDGLRGTTGKVIATGGGSVLDPRNMDVFRTLGTNVYLRATARELYQRIKNDTSRPLLQTADPRAEITRLLQEREPFYRDCTFVVETEDLSVEEVTDALIDELAKRTLGEVM